MPSSIIRRKLKALCGCDSIKEIVPETSNLLSSIGIRISRVFFKGGYNPVLLRAAVYRSLLGAFEDSLVRTKEPCYRLIVRVPLVSAKGVLADLKMRQARLSSVLEVDGFLLVKAFLRVRKALGYLGALRSLSRGRGVVEYEFAGYYFEKDAKE